MQFVAGTTLEKIIRKLAERDPHTWSGRPSSKSLMP